MVGSRDPPDVNDGWRCVVRVLDNDDNDETAAAAVAETETQRSAVKEALRMTSKRLILLIFNLQIFFLVDRNTSNFVSAIRIPQKPLSEMTNPEDNCVYFRVTEAVSPTDFYIQVCDTNGQNRQLHQLIADMNSFYSIPANQVPMQDYQIPHAAVARFTREGVTSFRRIIILKWEFPQNSDSRDIRMHSHITAIFVDDGFCVQRLESKNVFRLERR